MKILGIETSGKICGISILEDKKIIKEVTLDNGLTHSETLMPLIKKTFEEINLNLNDIDLIVCDKGPDSFTGIRIGIATAKAFSDALNIKSIGISSLEALCYNIDDILKELQGLNLEYNIEFVGDGAFAYKEKILQSLPNSAFCDKVISPAKLALCGLNHFKDGDISDDLLPMYLRKSQAEIVLEEKFEK